MIAFSQQHAGERLERVEGLHAHRRSTGSKYEPFCSWFDKLTMSDVKVISASRHTRQRAGFRAKYVFRQLVQ